MLSTEKIEFDNTYKAIESVKLLKTLHENKSDNYTVHIELLIYNIVEGIDFSELLFEFNQKFHGKIKNKSIEEIQTLILEPVLVRLKELNICATDIKLVKKHLMNSRWLQRIVRMCLINTLGGEL